MNKNKGFSLIELMVVVVIIGIVTSMAVPTFDNMIQRNRLKSALYAVQDDVQHARNLAIKQSQNITVVVKRVTGTAATWCYGLTTKYVDNATPACDCFTANDCEIKTVVGATNFNSVLYQDNTISNITFDFRRGTKLATSTVSAATAVELPFSTTKYRSSVTVDEIGRVRLCTNASTLTGLTAIPELPAC